MRLYPSNMKYVRTFESHRSQKNTVNEEFVGKLFQGLKNKLSLGFSKMFGNAKKADKLMEEYKGEVLQDQTKKRESLKAFGEYFKSVKDGGEKDKTKINEQCEIRLIKFFQIILSILSTPYFILFFVYRKKENFSLIYN